MEDNNQSSNPTATPTTGQIMDVQVSPTTPRVENTSTPTSFIPTVEADDSPMHVPPQESTQDENPAPEQANDTDKPSEESQSQPPAMPPAHKGSAPIAVIIAAIVIAIGLVGVTVYAYMQSQDKDEKTDTSQTQQTTPEVTGEDVDQTTADVDEALGATEEADFPEAELTDQTLGL
jgi:multisubunit Na+/H+ antiporter MnhC subunit